RASTPRWSGSGPTSLPPSSTTACRSSSSSRSGRRGRTRRWALPRSAPDRPPSSPRLMETPYYLIEEARMLPTLERIRYVQERSGARCLLALKCFSAWCAFDFMRGFFAGTTSSSLYEARLGREEFGGETHGY